MTKFAAVRSPDGLDKMDGGESIGRWYRSIAVMPEAPPEGDHEGLDVTIEELDLEVAIGNRLSDELVQRCPSALPLLRS